MKNIILFLNGQKNLERDSDTYEDESEFTYHYTYDYTYTYNFPFKDKSLKDIKLCEDENLLEEEYNKILSFFFDGDEDFLEKYKKFPRDENKLKSEE